MVAPSTLRGRDPLVERIVRRWTGSSPRVMTLTGLAGVGKTHLARHLASRPDVTGGAPVVWVDAGGFDEDRSLAAAELRAGLTGQEEGAPMVVIDGDSVATAGVVTELLEADSGVRFLVTSRRPLRIDGEEVVRVEPLRAPDDPGSGHDPAGDPAVELFLDVARACGAQVSDAADLVEIDRICRLLGGLPLAIEITASRAVALTPLEIRGRLDEVMAGRPLNETVAGFDELLSAIDWTESLLPPGHAEVLGALSTFLAPANLDAVERVHGGDAVDALSDLVDAHLVDVHRTTADTGYSLPPIVREHVHRRAEDADHDPYRWADAHTAWAVETVTTTLPGAHAELGLNDRLLVGIEPDLVAAFHRAVEVGDAYGAVALLAGLAAGWMRRGVRHEHLELASLACEAAATSGAPGDRAIALGWRANLQAELARFPADRDTVVDDRTQSLRLARGPEPLLTLRVTALAVRSARAVPDDGMRQVCTDGLALATELHDQASMARFEMWLAMMIHQDDPDAAAHLGARALDRARMLGDEVLIVSSAGVLRILPDGTSIPTLVPSATEIVEAARRCGDRRTMTWMLGEAALERLDAGDLDGSARYNLEFLQIVEPSPPWQWHTAIPLTLLTAMDQLRGDDERAARRLGVTLAQVEAFRSSMPVWFTARVERSAEEVRKRMGAERFEAAAAAGSMLTHDEAIAEALHDIERHLGPTDSPGGPAAPGPDPGPPLTAREQAVLARLATGDTYKDVARHLGIRPKTVMHHASNVYRKLGVRGRGEAVAWYFRDRTPHPPT